MADAALLMGDDELSIMFRGAKDPRAQVRVLADLNVCSPRKVADRLEALGLFSGTELRADQFDCLGWGSSGRRASAPVIDELRAMELFREGLDDLSMSEALGCSLDRVKKWRKRMHLLRPRGGLRKKKEEAAMGTKEEAATETAPPETEAEAPVEVEERRVLTVSEFLAVLPQLLTPTALNASLCINGSPVHDIGTICIRCSPDNKPVVDVMTDGGSNG